MENAALKYIFKSLRSSNYMKGKQKRIQLSDRTFARLGFNAVTADILTDTLGKYYGHIAYEMT